MSTTQSSSGKPFFCPQAGQTCVLSMLAPLVQDGLNIQRVNQHIDVGIDKTIKNFYCHPTNPAQNSMDMLDNNVYHVIVRDSKFGRVNYCGHFPTTSNIQDLDPRQFM